jgi:glc operon protein GlcG
MMMHGSIDYKSANSIVSHIMKIALEEHLEIAIAVSDRSGELLCFSRTDGCGLPNIQVALAKAFSAARLKQSTREFLNDGYSLNNLTDSRYTSYPGGFPVIREGQCLGGIGVSGLSPEEDEALCLKGVNFLS